MIFAKPETYISNIGTTSTNACTKIFSKSEENAELIHHVSVIIRIIIIFYKTFHPTSSDMNFMLLSIPPLQRLQPLLSLQSIFP